MIKTGSICPMCGKVSPSVCYGASNRATRLLLKRSLWGKYFVQPLDASDNTSYVLETHQSEITDGMPDEILVRASQGSAVNYRRCCPGCSVLTFIPKYFGKVPTFVIPVVGLRGSGKTTFLKAISNPASLAALARAGYRGKLITPEMEEDHSKAEVTGIDSIGSSKVFYLYDTQAEKEASPVACILFRDAAGELFTDEHMDAAVHTFLKHGHKYPGPDGLILIHNGEKDDAKLNEICKFISGQVHRWPPTAYVVSHVDKLQWTLLTENDERVTVLDKHTFPVCNTQRVHNPYYKSDLLRPRWALQDYLVRSHYPRLSEALLESSVTGCFLVKSCEGTDGLDFSRPINVLDPVIYLLNQLGIYSLKGGENQ